MAFVKVDGLHRLMKREHPNYFLQDHQLGRGPLVIDAKSIWEKLYAQMSERHDCFGGNYDNYAREVRQFFSKLSEVKISPFVTFFGGHVRHSTHLIHELQTVIDRVQRVGPNSDSELVVYPLWLREVFLSVIVEMDIKKVQFDFEDYLSTAFIAKYLDAPVLANDPNFFLYDVKYIPFNTLNLTKSDSALKLDEESNQKRFFRFFHSKMFKIEILLKYLGLRHDKQLLPIYAALLHDEDVIVDSGFRKVLHKIGIPIAEGSTPLKDILSQWLKSTDKALIRSKLEQFCDDESRRHLWTYIERMMRSYNCRVSDYLNYLGIETIPAPPELQNLTGCFIDILMNVPTVFTRNLRDCVYPPHFVDLIHVRKYYMKPQIENQNALNTHVVSYDIISAIYKILTKSHDHFSFYIRNGTAVAEKILASYRLELPSLLDIQEITSDTRRRTFRDILILTNTEQFLSCLSRVPDSWKLFLIAMKIYINHSRNWPMIYSMILCKLILTRIDGMLGCIRSTTQFRKQFAGVVRQFRADPIPDEIVMNVRELIERISFEESMILMDRVVQFFEMDQGLKSEPEEYDRGLAHSICAFQSCLLHVDYLNVLLNSPYAKCDISKTINSTFIYNFTKEIVKSRRNFQCITNLLSDTPLILRIIRELVDQLELSCAIVV